ncbi:MAG: hypothetical protein GTO40_15735 [Deltaproteobacteria bacterium]|nr:hypothetical protein [Deltaproteobacteria bacterium]
MAPEVEIQVTVLRGIEPTVPIGVYDVLPSKGKGENHGAELVARAPVRMMVVLTSQRAEIPPLQVALVPVTIVADPATVVVIFVKAVVPIPSLNPHHLRHDVRIKFEVQELHKQIVVIAGVIKATESFGSVAEPVVELPNRKL